MSTQEKQHFENDFFSVEASLQPDCKAALTVHVKPKKSDQCYKQAVKKVNKQISLPGFRKGKAPSEAVLKKFTPQVEQEWKEILLHEALQGGFELSKIMPIGKESLEKPELKSCTKEEGAEFLFTYECYPQVPNIDFSSLKLPEILAEPITEEKIEEVLSQIKKNFAQFEKLDAREIELGDYVDLTIENTEGETPSPLAKERRFPVEKGVMAQWMIDLLINQKEGAVLEGKSAPEESMSDEEKAAFKGIPVRMTVHGIYKILPPEIDDELAKKVGCEDKAQLLERIKENLEQQAKEDQKQKQIEALEDALLSTYNFALPRSLIAKEEEGRLREVIRSLKTQKLSEDEIKARQADLEKEAREKSEQALRLYFINQQIAKQGDVSLSRQEINEELGRYLSSNPYLQSQNLTKERSQEIMSRITSTMMARKTKEFALSQVLEVSA